MSVVLRCKPCAETGEHTVIFTTEQSLATAEACRQDLLDALAGCRILTLDAGDVVAVDLTFLQILSSLHRTAKTRGIDLRWASRPMPCLRQAAEQLGFTSGSASDRHFWRACPV
jgi:anti-anti-sigma regulatory factor